MALHVALERTLYSLTRRYTALSTTPPQSFLFLFVGDVFGRFGGDPSHIFLNFVVAGFWLDFDGFCGCPQNRSPRPPGPPRAAQDASGRTTSAADRPGICRSIGWSAARRPRARRRILDRGSAPGSASPAAAHRAAPATRRARGCCSIWACPPNYIVGRAPPLPIDVS